MFKRLPRGTAMALLGAVGGFGLGSFMSQGKMEPNPRETPRRGVSRCGKGAARTGKIQDRQ